MKEEKKECEERERERKRREKEEGVYIIEVLRLPGYIDVTFL